MAHATDVGAPVVVDDVTDEQLLIEEQVLGTEVIILRPAGELDMLTTPVLRSRLLSRLRQCRHVVLDVSAVTFLSSGGIQVLVEAHRHALDQEATLHVTGTANRVVSRPLEITGVDQVLDLSDSSPVELGLQLLDQQRGLSDAVKQ